MTSRGQSWCPVPGRPVFPGLCCERHCAPQLCHIPAASSSMLRLTVSQEEIYSVLLLAKLKMQNSVFHSLPLVVYDPKMIKNVEGEKLSCCF